MNDLRTAAACRDAGHACSYSGECAASSASRRTCVIVTWFYPEQPGFLDFSYRIRALARRYDVTLRSRAPIFQSELLVEGIRYIVLPTHDCRTARHVRYVLMVGRFLRR